MRKTRSFRVDESALAEISRKCPGDLSAGVNAAVQEHLLRRVLPVEAYGKPCEGGRAKPFEALVKEIRAKECFIDWVDGVPLRSVEVAQVFVSYGDRKLVEREQVFRDGTTRQRGHDFCSEKLLVGEASLSGAVRCMAEELGLTIDRRRFKAIGVGASEYLSPSYPGLRSKYTIHAFSLSLHRLEFREEYIEEQEDKTTYFGWS